MKEKNLKNSENVNTINNENTKEVKKSSKTKKVIVGVACVVVFTGVTTGLVLNRGKYSDSANKNKVL